MKTLQNRLVEIVMSLAIAAILVAMLAEQYTKYQTMKKLDGYIQSCLERYKPEECVVLRFRGE